MRLNLFIFIGLFLLCSSGLALKMNEDIEITGYGHLSAQTDQDSVYDRVDSYGDHQVYTRDLVSGEYEQGELKTSYTYQNSKNINDINVTGRYEAGLRMPDGIHHSIWVQSNSSIDSTSSMSYVNGDNVVGKTNFDFVAQNANLSESVKDFSLGKAEFVASTKLRGNFSLRNKLEESQKMSCAAGVLLDLLDATKMRGFDQVEELKINGTKTIIIDGKSAPADVQASYLQKYAADLITKAKGEEDDTKKREYLNEALINIDKALELYPDDAPGWNNKGAALYGLNRTFEAISAYKKAIALDKATTNLDTVFQLAEVLFNSGQYKESIRYYNMGLEKDPVRDGGIYWDTVAQAHFHLGEFSDAEVAIDKYLDYHAEDSESVLLKASIQYQNNNYQGAVESYESGLKMVNASKINASDYYAEDFLYLGSAYAHIGKSETQKSVVDKSKAEKIFGLAKQRLIRAKELDPNFEGTVAELIQSIDELIESMRQRSAGSTPAEPAIVASPINLTSLSNNSTGA